MEGCTSKQAREWRDQAKWELALRSIDVLDPTRRVEYHKEGQLHGAARLFKCDLQDISHSSVLLVNLSSELPGMKWGTVAEVAHAHTKNKIIIVHLAPGQWVHPFILMYANEIHTDMAEAVAAVKEYYL